MAIFHLQVKNISRGKGKSATASAAYRAAERIEDLRTGLVYDYRKKKGVAHSFILAPEKAPSWMKDRAELWNRVEETEKRKDSRLAKEIEVAIPVELNREQKIKLVRDFVTEQFVAEGMVADVNFHDLDTHNPHAHIMLTTRYIEADGFGQKNRDWNQRELVSQYRQQWAIHTNRALEGIGSSEKIDHRTLEAQGINRIPQIHLGANVNAMRKRGISTERWEKYLSIKKANQEIENLEQEIRETIRQINREKELNQKTEKESKRSSSPARQKQERQARELSPQRAKEKKRKAESQKREEKVKQAQEFSLLTKISFNISEYRQKPEIKSSPEVQNALLIGRTAKEIINFVGEWNQGQLVAEGQKYRIEMDVFDKDNPKLTIINKTTGKVILIANNSEVLGKFNSEDVLHFQESIERLERWKTSQRTSKPQIER